MYGAVPPPAVAVNVVIVPKSMVVGFATRLTDKAEFTVTATGLEVMLSPRYRRCSSLSSEHHIRKCH